MVDTKSDAILARKREYDRIEREADASGRIIGVRRLRPSQQLRIEELAPGLDGTRSFVDERTGKVSEIAKITPLIIAASVVEIDNAPVSFPKTRASLDAMLDSLDDDGLLAAMIALNRFAPKPDELDEGGVDAAKNSAETPA